MFDENTLYPANDPAVLELASYSTMSHWRVQGCGPSYVKIGGRVAYLGGDLNLWLKARTVRVAAA